MKCWEIGLHRLLSEPRVPFWAALLPNSARGVGDCTVTVIAVPFDLIAAASAAALLLPIGPVTTLTTGPIMMLLLLLMMMMTLLVATIPCRLLRLQLQSISGCTRFLVLLFLQLLLLRRY